MKTILGIETSCDETAIAIGQFNEQKEGLAFELLGHVVASQVELHQEYGGVYPNLAKREHQKNLPVVLEQALKEAALDPTNIDAIALTYGPGLSPCLWTGITFAQKLEKEWGKPVIPVDHMEGHLLVAFLKEKEKGTYLLQNVEFPALALVVSGGHTQLVLMEAIGKYRIIGETRDDAAGEAFDKTARILGLHYPGGPAIAEEAARLAEPTFGIKLPRPMLHSKDYDFSFSGLKTAVLYDFRARSEEERSSPSYIREMASEIQQAIVDVLVAKTMKAAKDFEAKTVLMGGGVSANKELKRQMQEEVTNQGFSFLSPPPGLSTDNGVMPVLTGYWHQSETTSAATVEADPNLRLE